METFGRYDLFGYGQFTVPLKETSFGLLLDHDHSDRVMLMGLPRSAGWRAISSVCLPHQTYVEKVEEWLGGKKFAREIAVLEVDSGEWETVWKGGFDGMQRADWMPKNARGCGGCRRPVSCEDYCPNCADTAEQSSTDTDHLGGDGA